MSYTFNPDGYSFNSGSYSFNGLAVETLDQETTDSGGEGILFGYPGSGVYYSQGITCGMGGVLTKVELQMKKTGSPTFNLSVSVWDNNSGKPNSKQSDETTIAAADLSTSYAWVSFDITSGPTVADTDVIHVVVRRSDIGNASNYVDLYRNNKNPYAGGQICFSSDGSTWDTSWSSFDLLVRTYVTG